MSWDAIGVVMTIVLTVAVPLAAWMVKSHARLREMTVEVRLLRASMVQHQAEHTRLWEALTKHEERIDRLDERCARCEGEDRTNREPLPRVVS